MAKINSGSLATAADVVALAQGSRARFASFVFSGTFTSAGVKFQASLDGSVWVPVEAVKVGDYSTATGNVSLTDSTPVGYLVFAPGYVLVRAYLVSISTGSVSVAQSSDDTFASLTLPPAGATNEVEVASADGAIATKQGTVIITKGSAAALTLAAPTATTDDGKRLLIVTATAFAHTVTQTTPGINNGSTASDVGTFTAAIGNGMELVAYNGIWYTVSLRNVTLA